MSTAFSPYGLKPSRSNVGEVRVNEYPIASAYGTNIFKGDPVLLGTDGTITAVAATGGTAQNGTYLGVFQGCNSQTFVRGWSEFYPASTTANDLVALVYDSRDTIFDAQIGSSGTARTQANTVGANANYTLGTGSTLIGQSAAYLTDSTIGTTATLPFKILKFIQKGTNAPSPANGTASDAYPDVEVIWNAGVTFKDSSTGVA